MDSIPYSVSRVGGAIAVNVTTSDNQYDPSAAALADGRFVVVWTDASKTGGDPSGTAVRGRLFHPDGSAASEEFLVNTSWGNDQSHPRVAAFAGGGFVVVWQGDVGIDAQVFDAQGGKAGHELRMLTSSGGPIMPAVAALANGSFVAAWAENGKVSAQVLLAGGTPVSGLLTMDPDTSGAEIYPTITLLNDGGFLVSWIAHSGEYLYIDGVQTGAQEARAQRFAADGTRMGDAFALIPSSGGPVHPSDRPAVLALDDGNLAVAWTDAKGTWQETIDSRGTGLGPPQQIDSATYPFEPVATHLASGGFAVAWDHPRGAGEDGGMQLEAFAEDGSRQGRPVQVLADAESLRWSPSLAALHDGEFVLTWAGDDASAEDFGVRAQIFRSGLVPPDTVAPPPPIVSSASVDLDRVVLAGSAEPGSVVRAFDESGTLAGSGMADPQGAFGFTTSALADGEHRLSLTATDASHNTSAPTAPLPVAIQVIFYSDVTATLGPQSRHLVLLGTDDIDGTGNALDNTLVGNAGSNVLAGGAGNDIYGIQNETDRVVEHPGEGTDVVYSAVDFSVPDNVESLVLTGSGNLSGTGNALDNVLIGNPGANVLAGGAGDDIYGVQGAEDTVIEAPGEGTDIVHAAGNYMLPDNVESLVLEGSAILGIGNAADNVLLGNTAANTLVGAGGADRMAGGPGDDVYGVDQPGDVVVENIAEGMDTVVATSDYALPANVEILDLAGAASDGQGNDLDNAINGNALDNHLLGGGGNDYLGGGAGNDTLEGGPGIDQLWGGSGQDTFRIASPVNGPDFIGDCTHGEDRISLGGLPFAPGQAVAGVNFIAAAALPAQATGPVLLYETTTGYLVYDSNGAQPDGRELLAVLNGIPDLSAADVWFA